MQHPALEEFTKHLDTILRDLKQELSGVRANRPTTALLENIPVTYYGQTTPMKRVASINIVPPREIVVQAWDKEAIASIMKAIESSSLGLTPQADGMSIRVRLPELSTERREELIKHVKKTTEQFKIQVRHFRDETNKKIQKAFDDEDQRFRAKEEVQKKTDVVNKEIETALEAKIKEIQE
ncbi:MAG: ribosome recycling factor [Candidatus Jorgensenbacteria bacterium]|nr:ribosome recycling factor [Candidatus Jorgensenbacteria bacterium]